MLPIKKAISEAVSNLIGLSNSVGPSGNGSANAGRAVRIRKALGIYILEGERDEGERDEAMTTRLSPILLFVLGMLAGAAIGALTTVKLFNPALPSHWFTLVYPTSNMTVPSGNIIDAEGRIPVSYTSALFDESDIDPPKVTALSGKAKFLPGVSSGDGRAAIGYVISVSTSPLDQSRLPEKYKKERILQLKAGPVTVLPLKEATYEVYFRLTLLDRDGFELVTVDSPKQSIQSGKNDQIQAQTIPLITSGVAVRTDKIAVHMVVEKCMSTREE